MGNIITLDQTWLSLPVYIGAVIPSYPWWLNTALAIWTLLALFWCWFLIFLFLLQHYFRQRRQRQYNIDRKSLREQMIHTDGIKNQRNMYVPLSLYDDIGNGLDTKRDDTTDNIGRNIIKNYIITETKNYSVKKDLSSDEYDIIHKQEIQTLPTPIVITVNMADERIINEPNWENAIPIEVQYYGYDNLLSISNNDRSSSIKLATAKIIFNMPLFFQQIIKYEKQPNIFIHQPQIQENNNKYSPNLNKKVMLKNRSQASDGNKKEHSSVSLKDEDEYKTTSTDILSSTLQNLILSYTQRESNLIADISREVTVTETIKTLLLQLEQQHENSGFLIPLLSADISYERQTAIHYQSSKSTNKSIVDE